MITAAFLTFRIVNVSINAGDTFMCSLVADCAGLGALFLGITHVVLQLEVLLVDALAAIGLTGAERAAIRTASSNGHSGFIEAIKRSAS